MSALAAQYQCAQKSPAQVSPGDEWHAKIPNVDGKVTFMGGKVAAFSGDVAEVTSPIVDAATGKRTVIGSLAQMTEEDALKTLDAAKLAWNNGQGAWPQMALTERIQKVELVMQALERKREQIAEILMWEICKNTDDAYAEVDRTIKFSRAVMNAFKEEAQSNGWITVGGVRAKVRRAAIGIMLALGPFNYPLNETYATLIPALLAGNVAILKLPAIGGLAHVLTMEAFAENLPAGTVNFVSGSGRKTMGPIMTSGAVDILAFIGGSKAADALIAQHPHPHRLTTFLQLEGKNPGIVMPDADLDVAAKQVALGSTSYNGQRCTAIKIIFVHRSVAADFLPKLSEHIGARKAGLPWESGVTITPLPETAKPEMLRAWIEDSIKNGAKVINEGGGNQAGALCTPAIVYPVNKNMKLWLEEQFAPVVPVAVYDDISEVQEYVATSPFGQQAAIFTSNTNQGSAAAKLVDTLGTVVGRININAQCARSPDVLPFSGRRSSALGTMSVTEAVKVFSTQTVLATQDLPANEKLVETLTGSTRLYSNI